MDLNGRRILRWHAIALMTITPILTCAAVIGSLILAYGLWQLGFAWVIAGLTLAMGAKLWFLDRMVWLKADAGLAGRALENLTSNKPFNKGFWWAK